MLIYNDRGRGKRGDIKLTRIQKKFLLWFLWPVLIIFINVVLSVKVNQYIAYLHDLSSVLIGALIMMWGVSVRSRIIHKRTRNCLSVVSWALFSLYVIRVCRWEFFGQTEIPDRICWYLYYLVFIAVPLFSFHAAVGISRERKFCNIVLKIAWVFGILLTAGTATNGLHSMLLTFTGEGTADHGWLYYALVIYSVLLSLGVLAVLIRCCRLSQCRRQIFIPLLMSGAGMALLVWYNIAGGSPKIFETKLFYTQDAYALITTGLWEGCIIIGLLPSNSDYQQLFGQSHINAVLKDTNDSVWYSSVQVQTDEDGADLIEHQKAVAGGSIAWTEDIHAIRSLQNELAGANEILEEENDLIEEENRITAERLQYEIKNRLYDEIAAHTHSQLEEIAGTFTDTKTFTDGIVRSLLLGTSVKRVSNLMILADANRYLSSDELVLALRETMENFRLTGADCELRQGETRQYPSGVLLAVYDAVAAAAVAVSGMCSAFSVSVTPDDDTLLVIETDAEDPYAGASGILNKAGIRFSVSESDGTQILSTGGAADGLL